MMKKWVKQILTAGLALSMALTPAASVVFGSEAEIVDVQTAESDETAELEELTEASEITELTADAQLEETTEAAAETAEQETVWSETETPEAETTESKTEVVTVEDVKENKTESGEPETENEAAESETTEAEELPSRAQNEDDTMAEGDANVIIAEEIFQTYGAPAASNSQFMSYKTLVAEMIDKVGSIYSQEKRYQEGYYDCSSLLARSMRALGLSSYLIAPSINDTGLTGSLPQTTAWWDSTCTSMKIGDTIYFTGTGGTLAYKLAAKNITVDGNPELLIPGTIMVFIEPGDYSGHVAVSLGSFPRALDQNSSTESSDVESSIRDYVVSQVSSAYGISADKLYGTNNLSGSANVWIDNTRLGTDVMIEDDFSGSYQSIFRIDALNPTRGVSVNNLVNGHGLNIRYVLQPVNEFAKPQISDVTVSELTSSGYRVSCKVSAEAGIREVRMPTWTEENGQDDLVWHIAEVNGDTASFYVESSTHNYESGKYITHIYLYDQFDEYAMAEVRNELPEPVKDELLYEDGIWYFYRDGEFNESYTGLVYHYGGWYYVENGILNWDYTNLVYHYGSWYYVENGILNWEFTGLTYFYGIWYYVENGVLNWNYTGLAYHYGGWYYIENGVLNWGYTGLTLYYGTWYYVENGVLNWDYTGLVYHYESWYYVENGALNWNYTGPIQYYESWYYVENGVLNWGYTGLILYNGLRYYVENGIVKGTQDGPIVCIDAGHQKSGISETEPNGPGSTTMKAKLTSGTAGVVTGLAEHKLNLTISLQLKQELINRGYSVVMIRETDDCPLSNAERAQIANASGAEIFVRIHANSSTNPNISGAQFYGPSYANPYMSSELIAASNNLSNIMLNEFCAATGAVNRGMIQSDIMTGINWCTIPVTIAEMGFMSNAAEDRLMSTPSYQALMVTGLANGIDAYFGR